MKKTFATIFIFILQLTLQAQWINYNPFPEGNSLRSVAFINDSTGWISGSGGLISETTDAGETWNEQVSGTSNTLKSIYFVNASKGWTVGESGKILVTSNGGTTWSDQVSTTTYTLNSVYFIDQNTGWAAGANGTILFTINGGLHWTSQSSGTSLEIFNIKFVSGLVGYAVGGDGFRTELILKTTDGGNSWTPRSSGTEGVLYSVSFIDESTGWAVGLESKIIKTTDGGLTWSLQNLDKRSQPLRKMTIVDGQGGLRAVFFKDANNGWTVGGSNEYYRKIYTTTDGGANWDTKYFGMEEYDLFSVAVTPSGKSWAVGGGGSIFYSEYGNTWVQQFSGTSSYNADDIYKLQFVNNTMGYAVGFRNDWIVGSGLFLKTTNGGKTWLTVFLESGSGEPIKSLFFTDENNGWAASYSEYIRHTTDGGSSWNVQSIGTGFSVNSLFFTDALNGFAGGEGIYKTTDAGDTWAAKYQGNINSIFFTDALTGWGIGTNIVKTTDGGETWFEQEFTGGSAIYFINSLKGWAAGDGGTIRITTDGGNTWNTKESGTIENLKSVHFTTEMNGWISGNNGIILSTIDGGVTWSIQSTGTTKDINCISFNLGTNGWAGGAEGTLLKYDETLAAYIRLISPNGGEELFAGNRADISWVGNISGNVNLYLYKGTERIKVIARNRTNQGSYSWKVKRVPAGNDYRIKIESANDASIFDFSDNTFSILGGKTKQYILITSPLGGEEWHAGDTRELRWIKNFPGKVSISLYRGNELVSEIVNGTNDPGCFNWTIPAGLVTADNYQIRINSFTHPLLYSFSDSTFGISEGGALTELDNQPEIPMENSLSQNFPNPFNPSTVINFNIAESGYITLKVYDITGREVASIVNENKPAGKYSVSFNGSRLASGVYFYILRNGSFVQSKKFLLVK